jgi:hypothetical protein
MILQIDSIFTNYGISQPIDSEYKGLSYDYVIYNLMQVEAEKVCNVYVQLLDSYIILAAKVRCLRLNKNRLDSIIIAYKNYLNLKLK